MDCGAIFFDDEKRRSRIGGNDPRFAAPKRSTATRYAAYDDLPCIADILKREPSPMSLLACGGQHCQKEANWEIQV
jgi:hypothetical protein